LKAFLVCAACEKIRSLFCAICVCVNDYESIVYTYEGFT